MCCGSVCRRRLPNMTVPVGLLGTVCSDLFCFVCLPNVLVCRRAADAVHPTHYPLARPDRLHCPRLRRLRRLAVSWERLPLQRGRWLWLRQTSSSCSSSWQLHSLPSAIARGKGGKAKHGDTETRRDTPAVGAMLFGGLGCWDGGAADAITLGSLPLEDRKRTNVVIASRNRGKLRAAVASQPALANFWDSLVGNDWL